LAIPAILAILYCYQSLVVEVFNCGSS
jgi:hypothetical protein